MGHTWAARAACDTVLVGGLWREEAHILTQQHWPACQWVPGWLLVTGGGGGGGGGCDARLRDGRGLSVGGLPDHVHAGAPRPAGDAPHRRGLAGRVPRRPRRSRSRRLVGGAAAVPRGGERRAGGERVAVDRAGPVRALPLLRGALRPPPRHRRPLRSAPTPLFFTCTKAK
eukprot:COSAG04_NODE_987_length_8947_cov_6.409245_9_plen_171_part_00